MRVGRLNLNKAWSHVRAGFAGLGLARFLALVIAAAYAVRILLMPFTAQNDLVLAAWKSHFVNQGHWNVYARAAEVQEERQIVTDHPPAAYPYGFYLFNAAWLELLRTAGLISLDTWHSAWSITNRALWFLLLKLPFLTADLAIGFILLKSAPPGRGLFSWAVWACSLSGAYPLMMGQNDLYPALFATLAAALAARAVADRGNGRAGAVWAALGSMAALGIGATFKVFPLMLAPPFALLLGRRWSERLILLAIPALIFAVSAAPFLSTPAFAQGVLLNFEGVRLFSPAQIFAQSVSLFVLAYTALLLFLVTRPASASRPDDPWLVGLIVFASQQLFSWTQFYWAVWLTPFLIGVTGHDVVRNRYWLTLWAVLEIAFGIALFSYHRDFSLGLLAGMSLEYRFIDLKTALAMRSASLAQLGDMFWSVVVAAQICARLFLLVSGAINLAMPRAIIPHDMRPQTLDRHSSAGPAEEDTGSGREAAGRGSAPRIILWPAVGLAVSAIIAFMALAPTTVDGFVSGALAGQIVLTGAHPRVEQTFAPRHAALSGVLVTTTGDSVPGPGASLRLCVRRADAAIGETCQSGTPTQSPAYGPAHTFALSRPLPLDTDSTYILSLELVGAGETDRLVIPVRAAPQRNRDKYSVKTQDADYPASVLSMALLRPFDGGRAAQQLAARLTEDGRFLPLWAVTLILSQIAIWRATRGATSKVWEQQAEPCA